VSAFHLTEENMVPLVELLNRRRARYYSAYPSIAYLLARYLLDNDIRLSNNPGVVFSGSETLLPPWREPIAQAFQCEVAEHYGAAEPIPRISECEHHSLHHDMELGVMELLPLGGNDSPLRRIVGTGFYNQAMPFIRYEIGDLASVGPEGKCPCGRAAPTVASLEGRAEGHIITPDGRRIGFMGALFLHTRDIKEAQLVQHALDHLVVNIVRDDGYEPSTAESLVKHLHAFLGNEIKIDVEYKDVIPREPSGKFRHIISHVPQDVWE
jgi:phenylacetate-CoA ligase